MRGITLKQIEAFYWTVQLGSFSKAAAMLCTTQPAVSARIKDFEQTLGVSLIDRSVRTLMITTKGKEVFLLGEKFLQLSNDLEATLGGTLPVSGLVRVGAADTIALSWLPELISEMNRRYPLVDLELVVDLSQKLLGRLRRKEIDMALMVGPVATEDVHIRYLGSVEVEWMCSPKLIDTTDVLDVSVLSQFPVLTHSRGSHLHQAVLKWFGEDHCKPSRIHGCNSLSTMIGMTTAGLGISVLPPQLLKRELSERQLVTLNTARKFPPNSFLVAHQSKSVDRTVAIVSDLAFEIGRSTDLFNQDEACASDFA